MKLHNLLYGSGFLCVIIGIAGIEGWKVNGTSLIVPVLLLVAAALLWYQAGKEDGKIRRRS